MIHIIPINDIKEHVESNTCPCNPNFTTGGGEFIVIHNAFDGREIFEKARENIKSKILNN